MTTRSTLVLSRGNPKPDAIIEGDWKLVVNGPKAPTYDLYDLKADPAEAKDVAMGHPEIANRLYEKLQADTQAGFTRPGAEKLRDKKNAKAKITMASDVHESDI